MTPSPEPLATRQQEAKSLLQQAGYGVRNKPLTLDIRVGTGMAHEQTARLIADQWREIGVNANIVTEANTDHFTRLRDGDFQVGRAGWIVDEADPIDLLSLLRSDNVRFNYARFSNTDFDRLLDQAARELDATKRADELAAAEALIARDEPVLPVLGYASLSLVSPRISGWQSNLLNQHPTRFLELSE